MRLVLGLGVLAGLLLGGLGGLAFGLVVADRDGSGLHLANLGRLAGSGGGRRVDAVSSEFGGLTVGGLAAEGVITLLFIKRSGYNSYKTLIRDV